MLKYIFYLTISTVSGQTTAVSNTAGTVAAGTQAANVTVAQVQSVSTAADTSWCTLKNATFKTVNYTKYAGDVNKTTTHCFSLEGIHLVQEAAQVCYNRKARLPLPGGKSGFITLGHFSSESANINSRKNIHP